MKKLLLIVALLLSVAGFSQPKIEFKALSSHRIQMGEAYSHEFKTLEPAIDVVCNGDSLSMVYENGKVYFKTAVVRVAKTTTAPDREVYTCEFLARGMVQYFILEKKLDLGAWEYSIKIPFTDENGAVFSYTEFISF